MTFLPMFLWPLLAIPMATASFARQQGRPYWNWFALGCLLPVISMLVLFFLDTPEKKSI